MRYVRYIGLAHERQITADEWRRIGITADSVVWNSYNGFAVPLDQFSDDQIRKAIEQDNGFVITGDEEFTPDLSARRPMTPQELESPRVDILGADGAENVSVPGSETSTASPGGTGRSTSMTTGSGAGHDEPS